MATTRYFLPQNVYARTVDDQIVVLDLTRDRYLSLDVDTSALLRPHLQCLTIARGSLESGQDARLSEVLSNLAANGILCTAAVPLAASEPHRPFIRPTHEIAPRPPFRENVRPRQLLRYIASIARAKSALRMRPLGRIVLIERRKRVGQNGPRTLFDTARAGRLCTVYSRLRVFATGPGQCLFDSLALKLFLAEYDLFPEWIFGASVNPFSAHCWLQNGETVVNDSLDFVRRFTPIMAV